MTKIVYILVAVLLLSSCGGGDKIVPAAYEGLHNPQLTSKENQRVQQLYFEGLREYSLENYDRAEIHFLTLVKIDKSHATAFYHLALINELQNDYESALNYAQKAIQIEPGNQWFQLVLAGMYEINAQLDAAAKMYESIVSINPKNLDAYYYWINVLAAQGNWQEMIDVMNLIENQTGFSEELTMEKEKLYLRGGDIDGAIKEVETIIKKDPKNVKYLNLLAELHQKAGNSEKALLIFDKITSISPNDPYVHLSLSDYYKKLGKEKEAKEELQLAFKSPELGIDSKVRILLGYFSLDGIKENKTEEALELGKIITLVHPEDAKSYSVYGDVLYRLDSNKLALIQYQKAVEIDNSKFILWNQVLVLEAELQNYKAARKDATKAIELFPAQPSFYLFKGIASTQLNKYEEALEALNTGKELVYDNDPLYAQFYSSIGDVYYKMEKHKESDAAYDKSLEFDPDNIYVLNNYSYYLSLRKENLDKAEKMSKRCNEISPRSPSFADTYGWILYQQEKYEDAKLWIENAMDYGADKNGVILEHYGDVLFKLGDVDKAKKQWKKAKATNQGSKLLDQKMETGKLIE